MGFVYCVYKCKFRRLEYSLDSVWSTPDKAIKQIHKLRSQMQREGTFGKFGYEVARRLVDPDDEDTCHLDEKDHNHLR